MFPQGQLDFLGNNNIIWNSPTLDKSLLIFMNMIREVIFKPICQSWTITSYIAYANGSKGLGRISINFFSE